MIEDRYWHIVTRDFHFRQAHGADMNLDSLDVFLLLEARVFLTFKAVESDCFSNLGITCTILYPLCFFSCRKWSWAMQNPFGAEHWVQMWCIMPFRSPGLFCLKLPSCVLSQVLFNIYSVTAADRIWLYDCVIKSCFFATFWHLYRVKLTLKVAFLGGLRRSLLDALPRMECGDHFLLELVKWIKSWVSSTVSGEFASQLKEAELLLIALKATATSQELADIEHEHRNLHFLKLAVCGLVLPLHLDRSCVKELYVTISAMQSRQLQLKELGQLVVSLWPAKQPWYVRAMHWFNGTEFPQADLTMMRHFLSSTLAQSPGLEAQLDMAMYLALGQASQAAESVEVQALQWLESCVGTSLLNSSARIQLSRRLLSSNAQSSSSVRSALNSLVHKECAKHGHADHPVAAILVMACQEELESKEINLNELRCHLNGLHVAGAKGLDFIWAVAAARVILVKAARMVKNQQMDREVAESALELLESSNGLAHPSRRALEVFLAKNLEADRITLAQLKARSDNDPLWQFLAFPAISDGLPPVSTLGHEICPSDCLMNILDEAYASLKEQILTNAAIHGNQGTASKVMALFSTSFLQHFNQRKLPSADQVVFQQHHLQLLAQGMLQNFPHCSAWQMSRARIADWVFMLRPVVHMAALSIDAPNSFWHQIFSGSNRLRDMFLPFMPGDDIAEAVAVLSRTETYGRGVGLYQCACGYTYTIGDCTQPGSRGRCPQCRQPIGGTGHQLVETSRRLDNPNRPGWRNAGKKGFVDTRDEDQRQTWRSLTVDQIRTGRYFLHGLLSLRAALQQPTLCHLCLAWRKLTI